MKHASLIPLCLLLSINTLAAPGAHGPDGQHLTEESKGGNASIGRQPDGSVIMPMDMQATLQIQTQFVQSEEVNKTESLSGVIRPHNRGHAVIQPGNNGHYFSPSNGTPLSSTRVKKGDVLGYIQYLDTAFELASQNSELLSVRNNIAQTQRDVERLRNLGELASEQELEKLETQLKTLTEQEVELQKGIEEPITLVAPQSGVLLNHEVSNGRWVKAGSVLFEILSPTLRTIEVHTNKAIDGHAIASASLKEYPQISINYLGQSPMLNQGLKTLYFEHKDRADLDIQLPIEQHVTVLAQTQYSQRGILLPASAIAHGSNHLPVVWIKVSAERFLPQIVEYQALSNEQVLITKGLGDDNRVVVTGTSLLNQVR